MITEIEQQFFDTFEIKPKYKTCVFKYCKNKKEYDCENCNDREWYYPQITDRILLELICILTKRYDYADQNWLTKCDNAEALKVAVLRLLLLCTSEQIETYKHQVRTLF